MNNRNSRNNKRLVRFGLVSGNIFVVLIAVFLVIGHTNTNVTSRSALSTIDEAVKSNPLDTVTASDVAVNVAIMARLPESGLIINDSDSVYNQIHSTDNIHENIVKPQILSSEIKTKADIKEHTVVEGETIESLAEIYGVTSDSIKWSNDLSGNRLTVGKVLIIPPVNGIVYIVKDGDNADTLAAKYNVNKQAITSFNDAEITGLVAGDRIVIPGGVIKAAPVAARTPFYAGFAFGSSAIYGYNGYVAGYCTWYAANKRIEIGRPLPANLGNAGPWARNAPAAGFMVNNIPAAGAVIVTDLSNPGHVGFVEYVNPDGSVYMTEMNRRRRFEITSRLLSPEEATRYRYIH